MSAACRSNVLDGLVRAPLHDGPNFWPGDVVRTHGYCVVDLVPRSFLRPGSLDMRNDAPPLQIPTVYLRQNRIPTEADTAAQIWSHENVEVHSSLMISVRTVFHA